MIFVSGLHIFLSCHETGNSQTAIMATVWTLGGRDGVMGTDHVISGPMRGLKTASDGANRQTDRQRDMATL